jgi:hypothetical protein
MSQCASNQLSCGESLMCPSSQPGYENCRVLGVVQEGRSGPQVAYLNEHLPATEEVLAMAAPAKPTEVFRLAAKCQTGCCPHYDGKNCQLATRIVQILPAVVSNLPPCLIRAECRWYRQEGAAACHRCPQIATVNYEASATLQEVVGVGPVAE